MNRNANAKTEPEYNPPVPAGTGEISAIDGLAMQARALRISINANLWQLARVFVEAKELVPHGAWGQWLQDNADVSEKTAQDMMAAYKRFGGRPQFEGLGRAKTFKLLPLPAGTEERFMEEHDVANMSTREVQEAVKQARAEAQAKIDAAEARVRELEEREPVIPDDLLDELKQGREDLKEARESARHFADLAKQANNDRAALERRNRELQADLDDAEQSIAEQQDALNKAQDELLNLQSAQARGDAAHEKADDLTPDVFGAAVREFMGMCARMPYMGESFAVMPLQIKNRYGELLRTMEGWCEQSRRALDSYAVEGGIVVG